MLGVILSSPLVRKWLHREEFDFDSCVRKRGRRKEDDRGRAAAREGKISADVPPRKDAEEEAYKEPTVPHETRRILASPGA